MHPTLQSIFDTLETQRSALLSQVEKINEEQFLKSPAPGKWSISQILTHLITSEQLSIAYMKKKSLGVDALDNSGLIESAKMIVLKISQRIPIVKFKAPTIVLEKTPPPLTYQQVIQQWLDTRQGLLRFLQSIEDKNIRKKIYKHPVAGRLDVTQALTFFHEHIHHHWPQVKRLL